MLTIIMTNFVDEIIFNIKYCIQKYKKNEVLNILHSLSILMTTKLIPRIHEENRKGIKNIKDIKDILVE